MEVICAMSVIVMVPSGGHPTILVANSTKRSMTVPSNPEGVLTTSESLPVCAQCSAPFGAAAHGGLRVRPDDQLSQHKRTTKHRNNENNKNKAMKTPKKGNENTQEWKKHPRMHARTQASKQTNLAASISSLTTTPCTSASEC